MQDPGQIIGTLEKHGDVLKRFGVYDIGIFGSFSTGDAGDDSDLDILITFEEGKKTFDNYMDLKFYLEDLFGLPVDLVIRESIKPALEEEILGSVVYAKV